jgi:hypothetical protein
MKECNMKAKFTKASKKDGILVTVSLGQFSPHEDLIVVGPYECGQEIRVVIDGVPTLFRVNRTNKRGNAVTATTKCFPRHLRLPTVGRPTYAEVTEIN